MNKTAIALGAGAAGFIAGGIKPGLKLIHNRSLVEAAFKSLVQQRVRILELEGDLETIQAEATTELEYLRRELGKTRAGVVVNRDGVMLGQWADWDTAAVELDDDAA